LVVQDRWFSPGIPASSTTNTGRHDIAEILLKVALKHQRSKINQINLKIFFLKCVEKNLQLRTTKPFMDEYNITQAIKTD